MKKIGIDDLFEGKIMDIVDFKFKPKPNPESLKLMCDKYEIPANKETVPLGFTDVVFIDLGTANQSEY